MITRLVSGQFALFNVKITHNKRNCRGNLGLR